MIEALGLRVMRLSRQSFAGLAVDGLYPGEARELTGDEIRKLNPIGRVPTLATPSSDSGPRPLTRTANIPATGLDRRFKLTLAVG